MTMVKLGLALFLAVGGSPALACKTAPFAGSAYDYDAILAYVQKQPELARYSITKIESDSALYFVSLETLNDVKCELSLHVKVASDCTRTVTTRGPSTCQ